MKNNKYLHLFATFCKIGATTFGGGYAMLPIIKREVVAGHGWLDDEEFLDVLAVAQSLPGAVAVNTAIFIGQTSIQNLAAAAIAASALLLLLKTRLHPIMVLALAALGGIIIYK